jgi:hypothetical protein
MLWPISIGHTKERGRRRIKLMVAKIALNMKSKSRSGRLEFSEINIKTGRQVFSPSTWR